MITEDITSIIKANIFVEKYEIKIKYDGERFRRKHTVLIIPLSDRSNLYCTDTDDYNLTLTKGLSKLDVKINEKAITCFIGVFKELEGALIAKYGNNVVISFSIIIEETLKYYLYIENGNNSSNYSSESILELIEFLGLQGYL